MNLTNGSHMAHDYKNHKVLLALQILSMKSIKALNKPKVVCTVTNTFPTPTSWSTNCPTSTSNSFALNVSKGNNCKCCMKHDLWLPTNDLQHLLVATWWRTRAIIYGKKRHDLKKKPWSTQNKWKKKKGVKEKTLIAILGNPIVQTLKKGLYWKPLKSA